MFVICKYMMHWRCSHNSTRLSSRLARAKWYVIYLGTRLRNIHLTEQECSAVIICPFTVLQLPSEVKLFRRISKDPFWMALKVDSLEERLKRAGDRSGEGRVAVLTEMSQTTMIGKDKRWQKCSNRSARESVQSPERDVKG